MDSLKDKICRICLDEGIVYDWNNILDQHPDVTYKDCYYTYTKLNCPDTDHFSCMLCQICKKGLQDMHSLILKAIDSYNFLLEVNFTDSKVDDNFSMISEDIETYSPNKFETVILEKSVSEIQNHEEFSKTNSPNEREDLPCGSSIEIEVVSDAEDCKSNILSKVIYPIYLSEINKEVQTQNAIKRKSTRSFSSNICKKIRVETKSERLQENPEKGTDVVKKTNSQNTPSMCSFCSKVLANKYALQKHERTHIENRERKEACPICGVKFFERANVVSHMHIHDEKREKKHQCEFCDKSFYQKGVLNVHRRIHLGQMISCTLCSKEFYRKIDLEIHMNSHSEAPITSNRKRRSRYLVHCKECGEDVLSTNYRAHEAAHLNEPLLRCLVCNKGFYKRKSITTHVREVHKKSKEEYKNFIEILHDNRRLSHLLLAQTTDLKSGYEN